MKKCYFSILNQLKHIQVISICCISFPMLNLPIYFIDLILSYTNVCIALYTQCFPCVCEKTFTGDSGGI